MIPMTCPSCGRRGTAPSDRVNVRMHCPKCDAVFHMDKHGKVKLGEPRHHHDDQGHAEKDHEPVHKRAYDEPYATSLTQLVLKSPWWVKLVLLGLIGAAIWPLVGPYLTPKPASLETLGRRAAYAFAEKRFDDLKKMAAPGTEEALKSWYDELRPKFEFEPTAGQEPGTGVLFGASPPSTTDRDGNRASMMIDVGTSRPGSVPAEVVEEQKRKKSERKPDWAAGYKFHGSFTLPTAWVRDDKGRWWLDGGDTLALTNQHPASRGRK